jgi:hypothetical protein
MIRTDHVGGWEHVRPADRPVYEGVEVVGYRDRAGHGLVGRVLPAPGLTIVLVGDGELRVDRTRPVVAGLASGMGVKSLPRSASMSEAMRDQVDTTRVAGEAKTRGADLIMNFLWAHRQPTRVRRGAAAPCGRPANRGTSAGEG